MCASTIGWWVDGHIMKVFFCRFSLISPRLRFFDVDYSNVRGDLAEEKKTLQFGLKTARPKLLTLGGREKRVALCC